MSFISVFDVLGPNMIGPSSSHTAGAAVIAYLAHKMIAPPLKKVDFTLYGSFAKTITATALTVRCSAASWAFRPMTPASAIRFRLRPNAVCPTHSRRVRPRPMFIRTPWTSAWRTPPVR